MRDLAMNQCVCENASTRLISSSSYLTPSKLNLPKPDSFSLFFYSKNSSRKNLSSLNFQTRPSIVSSAKSQTRINYVAAKDNESRNEPVFDKAVVGKRTDIKKIMILGAGPIVIGQACEFDYSGTQACKALREEGYEVILINSNPATIMTDPETANRTYIEPMTPELVEQVLEKERPDALLPTMGGQTALNLAVALAESGALEKYGVELIGAKLDAIKKAEDRDLFKQAMKNIGLKTPPSGIGTTLEECIEIASSIGEFPLIIRPAFTLGGSGGGIAYNREEFEATCKSGLAASVTSQVLVEKSLLGWKEYELEVMRDLADNVVIICSIENIDAMGVHTGDSITLAPAQTLTDKEYQRLRDYSIAIIREIGVECGGSNVQFAVSPTDGEVMVIEMNPRVSRSSALASKATGFPIAKMAAKLSVGYTLDQIPNDITKKTPASFEPSIDYVVTKIPRFAFEKFPGSQPILTTQMKSVGESMAVGRTFQESFQKAVRSLECGYSGWGCAQVKEMDWDLDQLKYNLRVPNPDRIHAIYAAMKRGMKVDDIHELTYIDKWFLTQLKELVDVEQYLLTQNLSQLTRDELYEVKKRGFSDKQIAFITKSSEKEVRSKRLSLGVKPAYKRVDTCAAEFEADTPYMYSSYDDECESAPTKRKKVLILGGGPNRIGQGIEFDYCCCHASFALQNAGYETIMMNSNPETVSTDYDTSDRLYFEPLTVEDVLNIIDLERPDGIIVQFGGQTPLKLALPIQQYLDECKPECASGGYVQIWGTSPDSIDAAEDRERFNAMLNELDIEQPKGGIAKSEADALAIASDIGYPVVVRPSYVLGGRGMEIVYSDDKLVIYLGNAVEVDPENPVLIDKYLTDAIEIDVDALADSHGNVVIGGIMEHIEQAGIHSGDSACMIPTKTISLSCLETIRSWTKKLAKRLNVCGLMNCQYAITASGKVFLLEANPRASRTVPFVSKAIGHPLAKYASLVMSGKSLHDLGFIREVIPRHVAVKEAVLPFEKFQGCDVFLGPEMRSTGEVMGIDYEFSIAFAKAQIAAGQKLPVSGTLFLSLNDLTKPHLSVIARAFLELGFKIVSTSGTAHVLKLDGIPVERVLKLHEGRPHAGDILANGQIQLMVITSSGDMLDQIDGLQLRRMALAYKIPVITTVAGALATAKAIKSLKFNKIEMIALQAAMASTFASLSSLFLLSSLLLLLSYLYVIEAQSNPPLVKGLSLNFFDSSCPRLESIVRKQLEKDFKEDIGQAAGLLRMHFHDCFVQGCDASVLLDGSASGPSEQGAPPNLSLRAKAFKIIDDIRRQIHRRCGAIVSCADITALTARDAIVLSGGPDYKVPLGRRDSLTFATRQATLDNLPPPFANAAAILSSLATKGFDPTDVVALSGAHTIGTSHCSSFTDRLYPTQDPTLDQTFAKNLKSICPENAPTDGTTNLDIRTPNVFDNKYYVDLMNQQGLFTSDQDLYTDKKTRAIVSSFAVNQTLFFEKFVNAMIKMGQLTVLTGNSGEIRANCSVRNSDNLLLSSVVDAEEENRAGF